MSDSPPALDLRLVPGALAVWLACSLAIGGPASAAALVGAGTLVTGAAVAGVAITGGVGARPTRRPRASRPQAGSSGRSTGRRRWAGGTAAVTFAAVAAALLSCAAQLHARESGLVAELVADRAVVTVIGVVRAEVVDLSSRSGGAAHGSTGPSTGSDEAGSRLRTALALEEVTGRGRGGDAVGGLVVLGGAEWREVPYGARVRATGRLVPGAPGERMTASLSSWGAVEVIDAPGALDGYVRTLRGALLAVTDSMPADLRGLVPGAAIGDTSRIPPSLTTAMRTVGLTHVTAVSGSHFAVLAVVVLTATAALGMPRAARATASVMVLGGFVLLVHPEASVLRAAVMGAVGALGLLLGRRSSPVPALAGSVVTLLVLDPWLARSYGFVLSVGATAAIVLLAPPLAARLSEVMPRWLALAVAVPAAAQLVCAPVVVLLDPAVSLYAVPANLLAAPALVPATLFGLAATVTAPWFPALATVLAWGAGGAAWWVAAVARAGAATPGARLDWPAGAPGVLALTALGAAVVVVALGVPRLRRERRPDLLVAAALVATALVPDVRAWVLTMIARG